MQARRFFLDTQSRSFVGGFNQTFLASAPAFFQEDVESIELYFLEPTGDPTAPYRALNYGSNTVKLAVGLTAPAALQTSWTSASTTITAGITVLTAGGSGNNEVQRLTFTGRQPAEGSFSLTLPSRDVLIQTVQTGNILVSPNHGYFEGQFIQITGFFTTGSAVINDAYWFVRNPTKNSFQISATATGDIQVVTACTDEYSYIPAITTPQIPFSASALTVQQAFVDAGLQILSAPQVIVTGSYSQGFTFTFANQLANVGYGAMTATTTLAAAPALQANVSFNTSEVAALIAAGNTQNLKMEVEVASGAVRQTYSTAASIADDIITSASTSPLPAGTANSFNLSDGAGGVWTVTVDASGILTTAKQ
jgi:hypothetical protein